jgi:cyanophycinase-like exopeptidase
VSAVLKSVYSLSYCVVVGKGLGVGGGDVIRQHFDTRHNALAHRLPTSIKFHYNRMGINLVFFIIMVKVKKVT